jgi:Ni,Fe-hydrogenase III small subunit/formate hydrogenlyase subunit 6/NADH:ubiquinone oxidoreductase subunit I
MMRIIRARLRQGYRTTRFPRGPAPELPERYRGLPEVDAARCGTAGDCARCVASCPVGAIEAPAAAGRAERAISIDLGRCLFCTDCERSCPVGAIRMGRDYRLATRSRADLVWRAGGEQLRLADALAGQARRLFGRSLRFREVSAGGCNACEADSNVLTTVGWDMGRFGLQFVASPRHADALWVTGPVSANMRLALQKTWEALPTPRLVVAVGACAISGGPFRDLPEVANGVTDILPVDLFVPGCPPHPLTILDGLLRLLGRIR